MQSLQHPCPQPACCQRCQHAITDGTCGWQSSSSTGHTCMLPAIAGLRHTNKMCTPVHKQLLLVTLHAGVNPTNSVNSQRRLDTDCRNGMAVHHMPLSWKGLPSTLLATHRTQFARTQHSNVANPYLHTKLALHLTPAPALQGCHSCGPGVMWVCSFNECMTSCCALWIAEQMLRQTLRTVIAQTYIIYIM